MGFGRNVEKSFVTELRAKTALKARSDYHHAAFYIFQHADWQKEVLDELAVFHKVAWPRFQVRRSSNVWRLFRTMWRK